RAVPFRVTRGPTRGPRGRSPSPPREPRQGLRGGYAVRHDRLLRAPPGVPGWLPLRPQAAATVRRPGVPTEPHVPPPPLHPWLPLRPQAAATVRRPGVAKEPHVALSHVHLWRLRAIPVVPRNVGQDR